MEPLKLICMLISIMVPLFMLVFGIIDYFKDKFEPDYGIVVKHGVYWALFIFTVIHGWRLL